MISLHYVMRLKKIAEFCSLVCHEDSEIHGAKSLQEATSSDITCFNNMKYVEALKITKAKACFLKEEHVSYLPPDTIPLVACRPYADFGKALQLLFPYSLRPLQQDCRSQSFIHDSVQIGNNCVIGPFCVLEKGVVLKDNVTLGASCIIKENVTIGRETYLEDQVTLAHAIVGERVFIKTGARIGQPGFGFDMTPQGAVDIPQLGQVIIYDDVQIGANTCIDRGSLSNTIIHKGVRIDNLVQIAHNVEIKENAVIVAQSGIAGSTSIGAFSVLGGQTGIAGHLSIGSCVQVAAQSGVMKNVPDKSVIGGSPAVPIREWHRQTLYLQKVTKKES